MTLSEALQVFLLPGWAVTNLYPNANPANPTVPWATFRRISGLGGQNLDGTSQLNPVRLEFTIWSNTVLESEKLVGSLRAKFQGCNRFLGGGSDVKFTTTGFSGPRSAYGADERVHGMQLDILGLLDEDTIS